MKRLLSLALLVWMLSCHAVWAAAPTIADKGTPYVLAGDGNAADPATVTGVTVSAANQLLVVLIANRDTSGVADSVVWDPNGAAQAFTDRGSLIQVAATCEIWTLWNPTPATNDTIDVSWDSAVTASIIQAFVISGADSTTPVSGFATAGQTAATSVNVNVTSKTGDLVVGILGRRVQENEPAAGGGETDESGAGVYKTSKTTTDNGLWGKASTTPGETTTNISWSWTGTVNQNAALCGINVNAAVATRRPQPPIIFQ